MHPGNPCRIRAGISAGTLIAVGDGGQPATRLLVQLPDHSIAVAHQAAPGDAILATEMVLIGRLTGADLRALELLCETLASEGEARAVVAREGFTVPTADGGQKPHPAVRIMETARNQAHRLLADFGLTPKGRQAVDTTPPPDPDNPFAEFAEGYIR